MDSFFILTDSFLILTDSFLILTYSFLILTETSIMRIASAYAKFANVFLSKYFKYFRPRAVASGRSHLLASDLRMTVLSASTSTPEGVIEEGYSSSSSKSAELGVLRKVLEMQNTILSAMTKG